VQEAPPSPPKQGRIRLAPSTTTKTKTVDELPIISYRHGETRKNNPEVGMVNDANDPAQPKTTWAYNPHLAPELQFDSSRAAVEQLIDEALASGDEAVMREALAELKRMQSPFLNWAGKAERTSFEVDTVSLHVHERIDPLSILSALQKRMKNPPSPALPPQGGQGAKKDFTGGRFQLGLFNAPFENLPLRDAVDFYHHDKGWSNRLVAGDSLLVMNSLLQKESMAGQVQMIYLDPPYGIKYGSNFQPFVNKRDVKDRKDEDLTQEPEMIKAFRDTWELGIHSYLTYLRDRLLLARDLLADSGSIFVQISDENLHHVRELCDEVFGEKNFCSIISFQKTGSIATNLLPTTVDFIVWYAKSKPSVKYQQLYLERQAGDPSLDRYDQLRLSNSQDVPLKQADQEATARRFQLTSLFSDGASNTPQNFIFRNKSHEPKGNAHWKTTLTGLQRLNQSNRIKPQGERLRYVRFAEDFNLVPLDDRWSSVQIGKQTVYVVQTADKAVERCMLMTTEPGDLVLDPTCGSGTTAFVAEKWGRRWITCDTSRVAVTLAKQRLMTASFDYFDLKYPQEGLKGGFIYKTVPHVTLKSIANNPEIDLIYDKLHPAIEQALRELNAMIKRPPPKGQLQEWDVPFDFPADWPESARAPFDAFHTARQTLQRRMDDSIAANAGQETLYDQPQIAKDKLRITGPFSLEAVPFPTVLSLNDAAQPAQADNSIARSGETSRQTQWRDELMKTGIRGKNKQMLKFAELETLPGTRYLHSSGTLDTGERVVVSFGPEHAALEQRQVENALREAGELFPLPKMIVFCAFTFDPEAAKDIDATKGITALKAQMNTDLLTEDLKKQRANNQSFWLMGQPDVEVRKRKDGLYEVEVHGFDYFDTTKGELQSGGKNRIAVWSLDTDYDNRSLFPAQVFFPMAGKQDGWYKLKKDIRAELDESRLDAFHGTVSLPFAAGDHKRIAVKIVDDRGIESLKVMELE
jgi:adenine-specific DNA-methyltransferase